MSGLGAAAAAADLVLLEATAIGATGAVAVAGSMAAAAVARHRGVPVWLVGGVGRVLPTRMWEALLQRLDAAYEPWDADDDIVSLDLVDRLCGPAGPEAVADGAEADRLPGHAGAVPHHRLLRAPLSCGMPSRRDQITMTPDEVAAFLAERQTMNVATIGPTGHPHVVAMWYGFLDGRPAFWTFAKSQKIAEPPARPEALGPRGGRRTLQRAAGRRAGRRRPHRRGPTTRSSPSARPSPSATPARSLTRRVPVPRGPGEQAARGCHRRRENRQLGPPQARRHLLTRRLGAELAQVSRRWNTAVAKAIRRPSTPSSWSEAEHTTVGPSDGTSSTAVRKGPTLPRRT